MNNNNSIFSVVYNFVYQIKKSIKLNRFEFKILWYFKDYVLDNIGSKKLHINEELPWITRESFHFINSVLSDNLSIFEFGSGGSSIFFLKRAKHFVSVEHNSDWYQKVSHLINSKNYSRKKIDYFLRESSGQIEENYISISDKELELISNFYDDYISVIDSYSDNYFDLIIIDGKSRIKALDKSIPKLKCGGYLIFDNADRIHYQKRLKEINDWMVLESYGPTIFDMSFNQTNVYQKPKRN